MKKIYLTFLLLVVFSVGLLFFFHNRFWWPPDNGFFAHVAERVANGEVLGKDIRQVHPGYVHFVNAAALMLFGDDFVSLRYPLVAVFFIQICLVFWLLARENLGIAVAASFGTTILGLLHFLNPDHHWYVLFFTVVLSFMVSVYPRNNKMFFMTGLLVATIFLFRQLTGILVGMGALSYFLISEKNERPGNRIPAMLLFAVLILGLVFYEAKASDWVGWILFGIWPILLLVWGYKFVQIDFDRLLKILYNFGKGVLAGTLPMLFYHILNGSLFPWLDDLVVRSLFMADKEYLDWRSYGRFVAGAVNSLAGMQSPAAVVNGLYWLILLFLPLVNGVLCFIYLGRSKSQRDISPLFIFPFMAVFYGLVSLHYSVPVYMYFSLGFIFMSFLMWPLISSWSDNIRKMMIVLAVFVYAVSLRYQIAQPLRRSFSDFFNGKTVGLVYAGGTLPKTHLWIDPFDLDAYTRLLEIVESHSRLSDFAFVFPYDPEIYFISRRKNPMPFALTDHGVQNSADLQETYHRMEATRPKLIIYSVSDKSRDQYTAQLLQYVQEQYNLVATVNYWEVYERKDSPL